MRLGWQVGSHPRKQLDAVFPASMDNCIKLPTSHGAAHPSLTMAKTPSLLTSAAESGGPALRRRLLVVPSSKSSGSVRGLVERAGREMTGASTRFSAEAEAALEACNQAWQ